MEERERSDDEGERGGIENRIMREEMNVGKKESR